MTPMPQPQRGAIPATAWIIAGVVGCLLWVFLSIILLRDPNAPDPIRILVPVMAAAVLAGYIVLLGYIYGDAKRRGMKYIAWTLLAALAPSAIGIILYFILRDPLQVHCTGCGCAVHPGFAYCPRCGISMAPTCSQCHKVSQPGWSHCAWCGTKL